MKRPEDALQRSVIELLLAVGVNGLFYFAVPNGGWRSPVEAKIMKGLGVRAGVHDIILCIPPHGRLAGLELKAGKIGRVSEAQAAAHIALTAAGGLSGIATDIHDAMRLLIEWGAISSAGGMARFNARGKKVAKDLPVE